MALVIHSRTLACKPNMSVEQEYHFRDASISGISITGEIISPLIFMIPLIEPIQARSSNSGEAGRTSANGLPRRVTRKGVFVLFTSSSNEKHFDLNSEIAISLMDLFLLLFQLAKRSSQQVR